jgi:hypothetical protein
LGENRSIQKNLVGCECRKTKKSPHVAGQKYSEFEAEKNSLDPLS